MRFTATRLSLPGLSLLGALTTFAWAAAALPSIDEPIFHLCLAPREYQAGFAEISGATLRRCHVEAQSRALYRYWLLASADEPSGRYMIATGIVKDPRDGAAWRADHTGVFLRDSPSGCVLVDPADQIFSYYKSYASDPSLQISRQVFVDLAADAVRRYSRAFGSRAQFIQLLRWQHRYPDDPALGMLKSAVTAQPR